MHCVLFIYFYSLFRNAQTLFGKPLINVFIVIKDPDNSQTLMCIIYKGYSYFLEECAFFFKYKLI